jgi:hypothetical protein
MNDQTIKIQDRMKLLENIILALCLTLNLGTDGPRLSIKPSAYMMPEKVFTNQANLDLVKKTKVARINQPAISIYKGNKHRSPKKGFQLRMPLPDLAAVFFNGKSKF